MIKSTHHTYCIHLATSGEGLSESAFLETALAFELSDKGSKKTAPKWIQVFPKGPEIDATDGRSFKMSDPQAFVDAQTASQGNPIFVDYDHLSSYLPKEGGDQTASGWIEALEVRDGEIWAKVAWTIRAAEKIVQGEWRYISPEFTVDKKRKRSKAFWRHHWSIALLLR